MIKLIGSFILAVTGVILAVSVCRFEQKKLRVTDSFISLLFHIKGQIDCYSLPLCDIMRNLPSDLELCFKDSERGFEDLLEHSKIYLDTESYRLLQRFYAEFGSTYREEQLKRCDYYIQALGEERRKLSETAPIRVRMNSILCLCCALGVAVVLW